MKKLMLLFAGILIVSALFSQINVQTGTLIVPTGVDSVYTFNGYARGSVFIEVDFRNADAYDGTFGIGGSKTAYDILYAEYPSMHNPVTLNLTNFPDTICRIERTVGLPAPYLKLKLTKGTVTAGKKYPITIVFDRF